MGGGCDDAGVGVDEPRYLARIGYTHSVQAAIDKLEAVDESTQRELTARAHRRSQQQRLEHWRELRQQLLGAATTLRSPLGPDGGADAQRAIARVVDRVDRLVR